LWKEGGGPMKSVIRHYILRNSVFFCVLLFAMALNAGFLSAAPSSLRLLVALAITLFIPGLLLGEMIFGKREFGVFEIVPIWLCVSVGMVFGPVLVAGFALHSTFAGVSAAFCGACLLILAAHTVMALRIPSRLGSPRVESGVWACIFIVLLFLSCAWASWLGGGIFGDAHNHLAFIRKIKEMPTLQFGRDQYFKELAANVHGVGLWNSTIALISQLSGMDILDVWGRLPCVIVPVSILAFFAFARNLFQRDEPAYLSTFLYIFWYGVFNIDPLSNHVNILAVWTQFHWPSLVTRGIFVPITLLFTLNYLQTSRWKSLAMSAAMALITTMSYLPYFINLTLYLAGFLFATLIFARRQRKEIMRLLIALFVVIIVCGSYAVPIARSLLPVRNPSYAAHLSMEEFQGWTIFLFGRYPLLNPARLLWPNPIVMLSFLLAPFLILYRNERGPLFLFGTTFILLGIVLNPPLLMYLQREDQSLHRIWRLTEMFPFILVLGFFMGEISNVIRGKWLAEKKWFRRFITMIFLIMLSLMCVQPIRYQMGLRADSVNALNVTPSVRRTWESGALRGTAGSVILTEAVTGTVWPVYFPHYILDAYFVICSPLIDPTPRREIIFKAYDYKVSMDETVRLLDMYQVDLIAINGDRLKNFQERGLDIEKVKEKFRSRPDLFSTVYDDKQIAVFLYRPPHTS